MCGDKRRWFNCRECQKLSWTDCKGQDACSTCLGEMFGTLMSKLEL